ncbi:MAG TPA: glycine cleavage system aminomethyltransferase GcvT, partial [Paracoccus sp.]|nr:glycine cleavage system aminomethyltransferase GcvT [Paracoccus sp. (in: a-proteobacteria)]
RQGGFPGAARILRELAEGAARRRVGLRPEGRGPMREGVALHADEDSDAPVGVVTSGAFGPSIGAPMSMGYLPAALAVPGTRIWGDVRGRKLPAQVVPLPFRPSTYHK